MMMFGYIIFDMLEEFDLFLVKVLYDVGCWVIVEGCYNLLVLVVEVICYGVWVVMVGFVIICLEYICGWYNDVLKKVVL